MQDKNTTARAEADLKRTAALKTRWRLANLGKWNANAKQWRIAHPEKTRAAQKKYDDSHREERREKNRKWRADNPDKVREGKRSWEAANPEKAKAGSRVRNGRYFAAKPEAIRAMRRANVKKWGDANPEKVALYHSRGHVKRKAKLKDAGTFTLSEWHLLLDGTGHKCVCCGIPEAQALYRYPKRGQPVFGQLTRDHIHPLSKGGRGTIDNIQPLCLACNTRKHDRHINYLLNDSAACTARSDRVRSGG